MGVTLTNKKAFEDYLKNIQERTFPEYIIQTLSNFGEMFIKDARSKTNDAEWQEAIRSVPKSAYGGKITIDSDTPSFTNRTTRLRNSIGYVVSRNGKVEKSDFESYAPSGSADQEGRTLGRQFATEIAQGIKGYALVCVAGAPYGLFVEAKGYDVITGSVLTLKQELLNKW